MTKEALRNNEVHGNYVDIIKHNYPDAVSQANETQKRELGNMKDLYIVGLEHDEENEHWEGDASKTVKLRIEEKVGAIKEDRKLKGALENVYETWQEKSLKELYKPGHKRYEMVAPGEHELLKKISKIEMVLKKNELIVWSTDRAMDYYLYCEKGVTEGVFIKVDVAVVH